MHAGGQGGENDRRFDRTDRATKTVTNAERRFGGKFIPYPNCDAVDRLRPFGDRVRSGGKICKRGLDDFFAFLIFRSERHKARRQSGAPRSAEASPEGPRMHVAPFGERPSSCSS